MGWLFAAALGLQRGSRKAMLLALPPIALGHAASVLLVTSSAVAFGALAPIAHLRVVMGAALIAWALYHHLYGHRHRVRVGMNELDVIRLLGKPTTMRGGEAEARTLLYAVEIGGSGFLGGSVELRNHQVVAVNKPVLK